MKYKEATELIHGRKEAMELL